MPGIYLPAGILTVTSSTERQEITFIARLAALSIRYPTYVLSGPSAAFLLGLPTACRLKDLFVYTNSLNGTRKRSSPVEWCNRFVSFGLGYAVSLSVVSSCWVGWGVSRDLVRTSRLR